MNRQDYQVIVDLTSEALGVKTMPIRIKKVYAGHANKNYITIPQWVEKYDEAYQIYYAVHEICHYDKKGRRSHTSLFKYDENRMLELWDIKIVRKKAYPKTLFCNGQPVKNIPK